MLSARIVPKPTVLVACLVAAHLQACADAPAANPNARTQIAPSELRADVSVEDALGATIELNHEVHAAYTRVKADLAQDRFALMDELIDARAHDETLADIIRAASREIALYMKETDDERLRARTQSLLDRLSQIVVSPRNPALEQRYHNYIEDVDEVLATLQPTLSENDRSQAEHAYYRAPAFNVLMSTRVVMLATLERAKATIEEGYANAIETNRHLVGEDDANERGYLYEYVMSWKRPPGVSAQQHYESDPVVMSIRRSLADQQEAVE